MTAGIGHRLARTFGTAILLATLAAQGATAAAQAAPDRLLAGALDIHAHADPDSAGPFSIQGARSVDVVQLARIARERGMRGFVIKQHWDQTAQLATLVRALVPEVEVFGGVVLNRTVGGINLAAVRHLSEVKGGWGRLVWMPTWDAEHYVRNFGEPGQTFVPVSADGDLRPEVKAVIAAMADMRTRDSEGRLVLATGHSSPDEGLMLVREARRLGVPVVVTHPAMRFVGMTIEQMRMAAAAGAWLEFVAPGPQDDETTLRTFAETIRAVGPDAAILSSDYGQASRPPHPDGLALAARALLEHDFSEAEIRLMLQDNPARLLGLEPRSR